MNLSSTIKLNSFYNNNCLDVLSRMEDNSIDLVYLDPPWNLHTAKIEYPDSFIKDYDEFIYAVLQQSYRVLKFDGNLALYSIPALNINFHNLIIPVFGEENFKAEFIIPKNKTHAWNKSFQHRHETLLFYSKSEKSKFYPLVERSKEEIKQLFPLQDKIGRYRLATLTVPGKTKLDFEWNGFTPPKNSSWRFSKSSLEKFEKEKRIFYEKDMRFPRLKYYEKTASLQLVDSVWSNIRAYSNEKGNIRQSTELLSKIIKLSTQEKDTVLDPFAGSAVSGISALQNNRKWIGVECNDIIFKNSSERLHKQDVSIHPERLDLKQDIIWEDYLAYKMSETEVIFEKIKKGENERLEFKEAYNFCDHKCAKDNSISNKIMKEIAAFLNSSYGGSLLLGVRDNGEIRGLQKDIETIDSKSESFDKLDLAITSKIKETFNGASIDLISTNFLVLNEKYICELKIMPSDKPVFINKEFYVRNGTQADTLKAEELFDLMRKRKKL